MSGFGLRLFQKPARTVAGETVRAYVPPPLPPSPPVDLGPFYGQIEAANRALGHLDGVTSILPDTPRHWNPLRDDR